MRHDLLDEWATWMAAVGCSPKTVRTRVQGIETLARHAKISDPATVTTMQIVAWLADVTGSAWTRQTYWYHAQTWCLWLVERGHRRDNPAAPIPRPKVARSTPRPVDEQIISQMLKNPTSHRAYAYTALAVYQGLRVHEIAKVRGEDVHGGWFYVRGKGAADAAIPAHPMIQRLALGMPRQGWWFPGADHGHVRARSVSLTLAKALRRAGSSSTPHALRHSFGTQLLRKSKNLRVAQKGLRHQSVAATQIYTEVADRDLVEAVNQLQWGTTAA